MRTMGRPGRRQRERGTSPGAQGPRGPDDLGLDDAGVSAVLDFIVGLGVFVVVLGLFLLFGPSLDAPAPAEDRQAVATGLLDALVARPGLAPGHGVDWQEDPDNVTALGLRARDGRLLDYAKVAALARGNRTADATNGAVDYPEARAALGLDLFSGRFEVHVQVRPRPGQDAATYDTRLVEDARMAYVGTSDVDRALLDRTALTFDPEDDSYRTTSLGLEALVVGLPTYHVLVVGSDVDHARLDRSDVREAVTAWVRDRGGGLVVLGSPRADAAWLSDLVPGMSLEVRPGTGDPVPANATAAVRTTPHALQVARYSVLRVDDAGRATGNDTGDPLYAASPTWRFAISAAAPEGTAPGEGRAFAIGRRFVHNGTVAVATVRPVDVRDRLGDDEAARFLANLVHLAATGPINLDAGVAPPNPGQGATAAREVVVRHPALGGLSAQVALTLWGG